MVNSLRYIRKLAVALMVSGSLNIVLLGVMFYWGFQDRPPTPYCELKPANQMEEQSPLAIDHSNSEVVRYFRKMSLEWLVTRLANTQLVENGYTQRDLALACLVAFYHFDLNRALAGLPQPQQKRTLVYGKLRSGQPATLIVYPGLSDAHYKAVKSFAATERWPLTSYGLVVNLRKMAPDQIDPSLIDAFLMTPEFHAVEMLFSRASVPLERKLLLDMIVQGNWSLVKTLTEQQKASQDLSAARRQRFLLDQIQYKSPAAAMILIKTDGAFAVRKLDDKDELVILELLDQKTAESEQFALALLTSPRSDEVWKLAAKQLYRYANESFPESYSYRAALARFAPQYKAAMIAEVATPTPAPAPVPTPPPEPTKQISKPKPATAAQQSPPQKAQPKQPLTKAPRPRLYVVQEGDSLWKISRRFNVDVEVIKAYNKLDSDVVRPGKPLYIPNQN